MPRAISSSRTRSTIGSARSTARTGVIRTVAGSGMRGEFRRRRPRTRGQAQRALRGRARSPRETSTSPIASISRCAAWTRPAGVISTVAGTGSPADSGDGGPAPGRTGRAQRRGPRSRGADAVSSPTSPPIGSARSIWPPGSRPSPAPAGRATREMAGRRRRPRSGAPARWTSARWDRLHRRARGQLRPGGRSDDPADPHSGRDGHRGFSGDGGPALQATFNGPKEIAVDRRGISGSWTPRTTRSGSSTPAPGSFARWPGRAERAATATAGRPHGAAEPAARRGRRARRRGLDRRHQQPPDPRGPAHALIGQRFSNPSSLDRIGASLATPEVAAPTEQP